MVKRVYGQANDFNIIFEHVQGDRWEAALPLDNDGEYVTELFAEDEAGNNAFVCSMLFVIHGHELQGYIVPRGFDGNGTITDYGALPTIGEFLGELNTKPWEISIEKKEFKGEIQEGGYTIVRTVCGRNGH